MPKPAKLLTLMLTLFSALALTACGGGGGNSEPDTDTGTLTLAITDDSIADWDQALITLSSVTLIGQGGQDTEMLDEPQTIDLLKLRNVSEFLAKETLTARRISKIRLGIDGLTLNKVVPMSGLVTDTQSPPTPSRKIDLLPQGPVEIRPGENVILTLDVDLAKSIKLHQNGNGQLRFRPVVFATVGGSGFARLYGTYRNDDPGPRVCDLERVSDADPDAGFDVLDICVPLNEDEANYFGDDGLPLDPGRPADGEKISIYGSFDVAGETLLAEIIARGTGTRGEAFTTLNGLVTEPWNGSSPTDPSPTFGLGLADQTAVTVALSVGAKVFRNEEDGTVTRVATVPGGPIDETALEEEIDVGRRIEARGALTQSMAPDPDRLQAFIAFASGTTKTTSGVISSIDPATDGVTTGEGEQMDISLEAPAVPACVRTDPTTRFFDLAENGNVLELKQISVGDLESGDIIDAIENVYGEPEDEAPAPVCLLADTVVRDQTTTL